MIDHNRKIESGDVSIALCMLVTNAYKDDDPRLEGHHRLDFFSSDLVNDSPGVVNACRVHSMLLLLRSARALDFHIV